MRVRLERCEALISLKKVHINGDDISTVFRGGGLGKIELLDADISESDRFRFKTIVGNRMCGRIEFKLCKLGAMSEVIYVMHLGRRLDGTRATLRVKCTPGRHATILVQDRHEAPPLDVHISPTLSAPVSCIHILCTQSQI